MIEHVRKVTIVHFLPGKATCNNYVLCTCDPGDPSLPLSPLGPGRPGGPYVNVVTYYGWQNVTHTCTSKYDEYYYSYKYCQLTMSPSPPGGPGGPMGPGSP